MILLKVKDGIASILIMPCDFRNARKLGREGIVVKEKTFRMKAEGPSAGSKSTTPIVWL
jgi:hypothetical protein